MGQVVWFGNGNSQGRRWHAAASAALLVLALLAASTLVVYTAGGTRYAYTHLAYVPILVAAYFFGWKGGLAAAVLCTIAMGPFMPLSVDDDIPQPLASWLTRGAFFILVGGVAGKLIATARQETSSAYEAAEISDICDVPTRARFERTEFPDMEEGSIVHAILFNDVFRITSTFGDTISSDAERAAVGRLLAVAQGASVFKIRPGGYLLTDFGGDPQRLAHQLGSAVRTGGASFFLSPTIGTARIQDDDSSNDVIRRAFAAAELAAEQGVILLEYSEEKDALRRAHLALLGDLRQAIDNDELYLLFQPKVRLSDATVIGCEALLRWQHPVHGYMPPGTFIPVVEYSPLMAELTLHVVQMAADQLRRWSALGLEIEVSVNVSVRNLMDPQFAEKLIDQLAPYQPLPLALEITESAAADPSLDVFSSMQRLASAGIELHVDDYGTGMSSLDYLKKVPATQIKIDQTFVQRIKDDRRDRAMVKSSIQLCRELGVAAVAEGVEDADTASLLDAFGCHYAQGYYFAKPLPHDEFAQLVAEGRLARRHFR